MKVTKDNDVEYEFNCSCERVFKKKFRGPLFKGLTLQTELEDFGRVKDHF